MKKRRQGTVEPVLGSLLNYFGLYRINSKGKAAAHKITLSAAMAYNLQKLVIFPIPGKAVAQILTDRIASWGMIVVPQPQTFLVT